jgi:hypothetical protein
LTVHRNLLAARSLTIAPRPLKEEQTLLIVTRDAGGLLAIADRCWQIEVKAGSQKVPSNYLELDFKALKC